MFSVKQIQEQLMRLGFNPGPADGIMGRKTQHAIEAYQIAHALKVDGIPGPQTLTSMFKQPVTEDGTTRLYEMPWLNMAISKKGLHENRDNVELRKFLKSDGSTVGDPSVIPWCGDFVETCIALTLKNEILPANPYLARNWAKFGKGIEPTLGAIGVFWRGTRNGIQGHVAFLIGKGHGVFYILGGNQSNQISVVAISTARLIVARWPLTVALPRIIGLPEMKDGKLSIDEA